MRRQERRFPAPRPPVEVVERVPHAVVQRRPEHRRPEQTRARVEFVTFHAVRSRRATGTRTRVSLFRQPRWILRTGVYSDPEVEMRIRCLTPEASPRWGEGDRRRTGISP